MLKKFIIILKYSFLFLITHISAGAQGLPNKQITSIWAPSKIKIDGKANEWGEGFQAYNRATQVYYTLANDGEYLYLIFQARDLHIVNKIYGGGLTFTITKSGEKKTGLSITFPVFDENHPFHMNLFSSSLTKSIRAKQGNEAFLKLAQDIRIANHNEKETLFSIYNDEGYKAQATFNDDLYYTCEYAIAIDNFKYLIDQNGRLDYQILIHPINVHHDDNITSSIKPNPQGRLIPMYRMIVPTSMDVEKGLIASTDFWGRYTLAKKP